MTKPFKSGNSQAVRIPADIAFDMDTELLVTRTGDEVTIRPVRQNLVRLVEELRSLPKPSEVEKREAIELPDRDGD